jgi:hypothetical protein
MALEIMLAAQMSANNFESMVSWNCGDIEDAFNLNEAERIAFCIDFYELYIPSALLRTGIRLGFQVYVSLIRANLGIICNPYWILDIC